MSFVPARLTRSGEFGCDGSIEEIFPLLCPKREEEWIPGWECETIWSSSGYNEEGAIFRTTKAYGTELFWNTLRYDARRRVVDFLIVAPRLYMFRFVIELAEKANGPVKLTFTQTFTGVSAAGNEMIERYRQDDFGAKLAGLERFMREHLAGGRGK